MSSYSCSVDCPNCGNDICEHTDSRYGESAQCPHCGYEKYTTEKQMSLEALNSIRADEDGEEVLPPLTELPEWNLDKKEPTRIVICIGKDGSVQALKTAEGIEVEVRDYNVPEDWDGNIKKDEDGEAYESVVFDEDGEQVEE